MVGALQMSAFNLAQKDHAMLRILQPERPALGREDPSFKKFPLEISAFCSSLI